MSEVICRFAQTRVSLRLNSSVSLQYIIETIYSVVRVILTQLGQAAEDISDLVVQRCFSAVKENAKHLADWIVHAVEEGLPSLKRYLRSHPQLLNNLKAPLKKALLGKGAIRVPATIASFGVKGATKVTNAAVFSFYNPGGIAADIAQAALESHGEPEAGMLVGAAGNAVSGVVAGGMIGGPPGAVAGAAVSLGIWGFGELVGKFFQNE